ncbi:MAG: VOC family protein [Hyphomicrobiales bacterium]|nr:VOC family protein [Hyphomicrobiales bacterium]
MANLVPELYCSDFARSSRFYVDLLGFQILYDRPEERFAYLEREGAELMIEEPTGRVWLTASLSYPFGRGINLQIAVSQIDKLYDKCQLERLPIFLAMEEKFYRRGDTFLGCRQFILQDPDGYLLRFQEKLGPKPAPG